MVRDRDVKRLVSAEALFHRFADVFRGFFLLSFACLALLGFVGTGYFAVEVVMTDMPKVPAMTKQRKFKSPTIEEFQQFADRILEGVILWPTLAVPDRTVKVEGSLSMKESRAIESGAALLESLVAARGVQEDEARREKSVRLITHIHHKLSSLPGAPDLSFASLLFDHLMQASLSPAYFPNKQSVVGQKRERVDRFLIDYPLIHVEWFSQQVEGRIEGLVRGSDRYAADQAEFQLRVALADQNMQRNAILCLVCLVMFALSALLFLLIRIERNQTLQTQYMANRYVMYMPTPQSDP